MIVPRTIRVDVGGRDYKMMVIFMLSWQHYHKGLNRRADASCDELNFPLVQI